MANAKKPKANAAKAKSILESTNVLSADSLSKNDISEKEDLSEETHDDITECNNDILSISDMCVDTISKYDVGPTVEELLLKIDDITKERDDLLKENYALLKEQNKLIKERDNLVLVNNELSSNLEKIKSEVDKVTSEVEVISPHNEPPKNTNRYAPKVFSGTMSGHNDLLKDMLNNPGYRSWN